MTQKNDAGSVLILAIIGLISMICGAIYEMFRKGKKLLTGTREVP